MSILIFESVSTHFYVCRKPKFLFSFHLKVLAHCNDVSTSRGNYEALNERLEYLNQNVDSTRVEFAKDKEELRKKINEVLERVT